MQDREYEILADFRNILRKFLKFSEDAAITVGLTPQQHQALLFIRSSRQEYVTVGELAHWMQVKPNSAAELSNRLKAAALIYKKQDSHDKRRILLELSEHGHQVLQQLTQVHRDELQELKQPLRQLLMLLDEQA